MLPPSSPRVVRSTSRRAPRPSRTRLHVEPLEDRTVPSTLTVTNLNDSGDGSLRFELAQAQAGDTVDFDSGLQGTLTLTFAAGRGP